MRPGASFETRSFVAHVETGSKMVFECEFSATLRNGGQLAKAGYFRFFLAGLTRRKSLSHVWCLPDGDGRPPGKV
jgi:hypothetical protein